MPYKCNYVSNSYQSKTLYPRTPNRNNAYRAQSNSVFPSTPKRAFNNYIQPHTHFQSSSAYDIGLGTIASEMALLKDLMSVRSYLTNHNIDTWYSPSGEQCAISCPFHDHSGTKKKLFFHTTKGLWHCKVCSESGSSIASFHAKLHNIPLQRAVAELSI